MESDQSFQRLLPVHDNQAPDINLFVAIGASAAGLEAFEDFFSHCPTDTGMCFIVIQHLSPDYKSMMSELLARRTRMPLHQVSDGNPERNETLTITAVSSKPDVALVKSITYSGGTEATLDYEAGSVDGFSIITVYVQDDMGGAAYSDESDIDSVTFVVQVRDSDPSANNAAVFTAPSPDPFNTNTGQNIVVIPNVDDGDAGKVQDIVFTAQSGNTDLVEIDSVSYEPGAQYALLYFKEKGAAGEVSISLQCQDQEDIDAGGDKIFEMPFKTHSPQATM